ncbi:MAG: hypothetical protein ABSC18_01320 [Verrucomicrobiota bacterium]|jgi:spore coat polysaccharide biosynthesis protein SpsF (cytidylyltransferase family)
MKTGILILARCGSTRLPQKHLQAVGGQPIISYLLRRIDQHFRMEIEAASLRVVVATGDEPQNRAFEDVVAGLAQVFYGSSRNIPLRQLQAAEAMDLDCIISVDGDDILCSPTAMGAVHEALHDGIHYAKTAGLPLGMNAFGYTRAFLKSSLQKAPRGVLETGWGRIFDEATAKTIEFNQHPGDRRLRFTLDYPEDLEFFRGVLAALGGSYLTCSDETIIRLVLDQQLFCNANVVDKYWENFHKGKAAEDSVPNGGPGPESSI